MTRQMQQMAAIALFALAAGRAAADTGTQFAALESAAWRGDPVAQTALALKYEHAEGVPKNLRIANALYCEAAKQGHAEAQFSLGWLYANGRGVPRDDGVAAALFELASNQGHQQATRLGSFVRQQADTPLPSCLQELPLLLANEISLDELTAADGHTGDERSGPGSWLAQGGKSGAERSEIEHLVHRLAPQYAVDPELALAVISVESAFNVGAVSPKNALGLMQLIPETAERFGVKRVFNATDNIKGGLAYLRWLLAFFQGDVALVAAAYNAGEGAVEKYRGIPPYAETRRYVRKITGLYTKPSHRYEPGVVGPSLIMAKTTRGRN